MIGYMHQDDWWGEPRLYLLMYIRAKSFEGVTIKNTTFSTHKVFNETYAHLKIFNESSKDN
jgi:hypothetical protein